MPKSELKTPIAVRRRDSESASEERAQEALFSQDLIAIFARHYLVLLLGPLLVALAAYGFAMTMPSRYVSIAFLRIDRAVARSMEALITSPAIADKVLAKYPGTGSTPEGRVRFLSGHFVLTDIEPSSDRSSVRLFRLEVSHSEPAVAQAISKDLIDAWLETTRPGPLERANIEAEIRRQKGSVAANSTLIEQLQKEATHLVLPDSIQGEIATPISQLLSKRDQSLARITALEDKLSGVPRDVIISPPHLPREPTGPRKGAIALLSGIASIPVLLALIVLGHAVRQRA